MVVLDLAAIGLTKKTINVTLYHGSHIQLNTGVVSGSFFSSNQEVAARQAYIPQGCNLYKFVGDIDFFWKNNVHDIYISTQFIPMKYLTLLIRGGSTW